MTKVFITIHKMFKHGFLEAYKILFVSDLAGDLIPEVNGQYCEGPPSLWLPFELGADINCPCLLICSLRSAFL